MLVPRKLTAVLSLDESNALLRRPKYRTALSLTYGAGLRVSEVVALRGMDIDSERMHLQIEQAKGKKT
jgi:integrase